MRYRVYPRTGWGISEIGYGMWGLGGWTGPTTSRRWRRSPKPSLSAATSSTRRGPTAPGTANVSRQTLRAHADRRLYVATKVPPKNQKWIQLEDSALDDVFPPDHIRRYTESSLENLGLEAIDLQQLHAWSDRWAGDDRWQRTMDDLKREGLVRSWGISVNRWETTNVLQALDTGLIDCVQVVYNIFDQDPEDVLLPYCRERGIAVVARVPFDEGSLTGTLTRDTRFPDGDWRNLYFTPAQLEATLPRVERLKPLVPPGQTLPEMALRFILHHPAVTTAIPGIGSSPTYARTARRATASRWTRSCWRRCACTAGAAIGLFHE